MSYRSKMRPLALLAKPPLLHPYVCGAISRHRAAHHRLSDQAEGAAGGGGFFLPGYGSDEWCR